MNTCRICFHFLSMNWNEKHHFDKTSELKENLAVKCLKSISRWVANCNTGCRAYIIARSHRVFAGICFVLTFSNRKARITTNQNIAFHNLYMFEYRSAQTLTSDPKENSYKQLKLDCLFNIPSKLNDQLAFYTQCLSV